MKVNAKFTTTDLIGDVQERLGKLEPFHKAALELWREDIIGAMDKGVWYPLSGAARQFEPTVPFGELHSGGESKLKRSGRLRKAIKGGTGGFDRVSGKKAVFGVNTSEIPYALVHRGGSGKITAAVARRPHKLKVTDRMRGFLARSGVRLKASTKTLTTPRRPWGTQHPRLRTQMRGLMTAHVAGRLRG
ncbi:MAG: hypothetical protein AAFX50_16760 [Acidobacteriota bacterium]